MLEPRGNVDPTAREAARIRVEGVVQGVGFRPFVFRLAEASGLAGWVLNSETGVEIHVEGGAGAVADFGRRLEAEPPPAARISRLTTTAADVEGHREFCIRRSGGEARPTVRIAPDLPVCDACLRELFDPGDRRYRYPYLNCTDCGPRYTILQGLPYDRPQTTLRGWTLCPACAGEYQDPRDRRFHAQPVACPACGPHYVLRQGEIEIGPDGPAIEAAADLLRRGGIVAVKGLGGYHLACDAGDRTAVAALRTRKFRKEKPFAVMVRDLETARRLVTLSPASEELLTSIHRPIVLAPARLELPEVAPGIHDLGVLLAYTPLHHLLFDAGAPEILVMTSANRSSEPIAYRDGEALERLDGIADAFLVGERPIARRVDDSVVRAGPLGPVVLRRARGYAPSAAGRLPVDRPVLAVGADLKNSITLGVGGEAFVSQHLGDLAQVDAFEAFRETIEDLTAMYRVDPGELLVVHDLHPEYASTRHAQELEAAERRAVQHHRAHVASVLAEREAWDERVVGVAFDGTGYGDDGAIWGGELFVGSLREGLERAGHLRTAPLPGGDAAARHPVQAAAGFLFGLDGLPDLAGAPFGFPRRYREARLLVDKGVRTFRTSSAGRLFDAVAALLGFTGEVTFEGQAAIWLEQLARTAGAAGAGDPMPWSGGELDYRPLLLWVAGSRRRGMDPAAIARGFHARLAGGLADAVADLAAVHRLGTVAFSGGVFQNQLLVADLMAALERSGLEIWGNREVPPNDGGVSFGQAAFGCASIPLA